MEAGKGRNHQHHQDSLPELAVASERESDIFLTYFAAQVHLAFNNDLRPSQHRIIEVSRRLGITRQQCLLLLKAGSFSGNTPLGSAAVSLLSSDEDYRQHALANPDDYCVVAVSNVIEKIKEFPSARSDIFDKLPGMLTAFDQTLSSSPMSSKPFWNYKRITLFLKSFFLEDHVTTSSGGLVGVAAKGHKRVGCSTNTVSPQKPSTATKPLP